jgi:hypothetical protein
MSWCPLYFGFVMYYFDCNVGIIWGVEMSCSDLDKLKSEGGLWWVLAPFQYETSCKIEIEDFYGGDIFVKGSPCV